MYKYFVSGSKLFHTNPIICLFGRGFNQKLLSTVHFSLEYSFRRCWIGNPFYCNDNTTNWRGLVQCHHTEIPVIAVVSLTNKISISNSNIYLFLTFPSLFLALISTITPICHSSHQDRFSHDFFFYSLASNVIWYFHSHRCRLISIMAQYIKPFKHCFYLVFWLFASLCWLTKNGKIECQTNK